MISYVMRSADSMIGNAPGAVGSPIDYGYCLDAPAILPAGSMHCPRNAPIHAPMRTAYIWSSIIVRL